MSTLQGFIKVPFKQSLVIRRAHRCLFSRNKALRSIPASTPGCRYLGDILRWCRWCRYVWQVYRSDYRLGEPGSSRSHLTVFTVSVSVKATCVAWKAVFVPRQPDLPNCSRLVLPVHPVWWLSARQADITWPARRRRKRVGPYCLLSGCGAILHGWAASIFFAFEMRYSWRCFSAQVPRRGLAFKAGFSALDAQAEQFPLIAYFCDLFAALLSVCFAANLLGPFGSCSGGLRSVLFP